MLLDAYARHYPKMKQINYFFYYYLAYDFLSNDISGITGLALLEERKLN